MSAGSPPRLVNLRYHSPDGKPAPRILRRAQSPPWAAKTGVPSRGLRAWSSTQQSAARCPRMTSVTPIAKAGTATSTGGPPQPKLRPRLSDSGAPMT